jgi:hypothetical protein
MAKKKKSHKKHQFKYAAPTKAPSASSSLESGKAVVTAARPVTLPTLNYEIKNLSLIVKDIRKVVLLGSVFVFLQLVLWGLFEYTGLGEAVYSLIKV